MNADEAVDLKYRLEQAEANVGILRHELATALAYLDSLGEVGANEDPEAQMRESFREALRRTDGGDVGDVVLEPDDIRDDAVITEHVTGNYLCDNERHLQQSDGDGRKLPCASCDPRPVLRSERGTWTRERTMFGWAWVTRESKP